MQGMRFGGSPHVADCHLRDANVWGLQAGEEDGFGDGLRLHHVGATDVIFGAALAKGEFGLSASGTDGTDVDVVLAEFGIECLGKADLGELGSTVNGLASVTLEAGDGRDEEKDAALLRNHLWYGVTREEEAGLHVGVHELVVLGARGVDEVFIVSGAGIVDEDVEAAEGRERELHGVLCGVFVGSISGMKDAASSGGLDLRAESVEALRTAGRDDEVSAVTREGKSSGVTNTGTCAGNDRNLSGEQRRHR